MLEEILTLLRGLSPHDTNLHITLHQAATNGKEAPSHMTHHMTSHSSHVTLDGGSVDETNDGDLQ